MTPRSTDVPAGALPGRAAAALPESREQQALPLIALSVLRARRRTGGALGSGSDVAHDTQVLLRTCLAAALLVGLVLDAALGWSWADAAATSSSTTSRTTRSTP